MSYQKILDRQKALRNETLQIALKNSETAAIANKDLDNGVIQMVQDTRSRYEIEQDKQEQENMAFTNIKKLFKNDAQEIAKSIKYLKSDSKLMLVFNKYYGQIYKDLDGIYNLIYKDFKNYFQRFYDKITTTQGVDRPAQVENIAQLQQGITDLQEQQENATDNIIQNMDINNLNITKAQKGYVEKIKELNDIFLATNDADLRDDMDALGLTETFLTTQLPFLDDTSISVQERNNIMDVIKRCKTATMKKLLKKYGSAPVSSPPPMINPSAPSPTSMSKAIYNDGDIVDIEESDGSKNDYVIFGTYAYPLITKGASKGLYSDKPTYEFDNDGFYPLKSNNSIPRSAEVDMFNIPIFQKIAAAAAPTTTYPPDETIYNFSISRHMTTTVIGTSIIECRLSR